MLAQVLKMRLDSTSVKKINRGVVLLVCILAALTQALAQSTDPNLPSPIRNNNLLGKIAARDLGDSRLTNHYYTFKATPGDLLITVNSRNLNGDIDVFTAGTLRPLLKLTLYAESTTPITKGVYLRRAEDLILRIEARSPNDDEGSYELLFSGSFQPIYGGEEVTENVNTPTEVPTAPGVGTKTRRVSSVGARIAEPTPPVTEVAAAAPTPEPTPEPTPAPSPEESPTPVVVEKRAESEGPAARPPRRSRTRRPADNRTTKPTTSPTEEAKSVTTSPTEAETKPAAPAAETNKRVGTNTRSAKPPPEPEPDTGPRLIIETNDGTLINRAMRSVRRVTVENGQVVVLNRDGTINRILLANVVRMTIQP